MHGRAKRKPSVCLSVCLSNAWIVTNKETCVHILTPHERSFILVSDKKNGWWAQPLLPEILDQLTPLEQKRWWTVYLPLSPKGVQKRKNGRFPWKSALLSKKVCYKVSLCKYCQRQSCITGLFIRVKMVRRERQLYTTWKFGRNWPNSFKNADFQSIFARGASAVTPDEKVQLTRIGSSRRAFQWA